MKIILPLALLLLYGCTPSEPTPVAGFQTLGDRDSRFHYKITPWKHGAKGAYAIILDDYCFDEAHGIQDHAAPEADQRGIRIGFGVVAGSCDAGEWSKARAMIASGHEIINHTYNHRCASLQTPWCTDVWSDDEVIQEIDAAATAISQHTGVSPSFFIFPYDLHTPAKIEHLRNSGYIGARTGVKQALNQADFDDPFALNFDVKFPPDASANQGFTLNGYVDAAIARNAFALRAIHGVNDQSWGVTSLEELREHFDYLQIKNASYELWTDTVSNIIRYNEARQHCTLAIEINAGATWITVGKNSQQCPQGQELSIVINAENPVQIMDNDGNAIPLINNTYTLKTGSRYRFF